MPLINKPINDYAGNVEFSAYPSGIYFLEITEGKTKHTEKIVKN